MTYPTEAVANYFLERAFAAGEDISPMKLQKLVYFAQGWHLGILDEPLIDEQVEAWQYGPVIRSLYQEFKEFGNQPIDRLAAGSFFHGSSKPQIPTDAGVTRDILDKVFEAYVGFSASRLSMMTHAPGTPWSRTVERYEGSLPRGTDIPQDVIRDHFHRLAYPEPATSPSNQ